MKSGPRKVGGLKMGLFKPRIKASNELGSAEPAGRPPEEPPVLLEEIPKEFLWLADAPLFIDSVQVESFYDAILRPDYELSSVTLQNSITRTTTIGGTATVGAAFPFFGKAQLEATAQYSGAHDRSTASALSPIKNSYRHLLTMALYYAGLAKEDATTRLVTHSAGDSLGQPEWLTDDYIQRPPRALVFLDVPKGTQIMPAALETAKGEVKVMANAIEGRLKEKGAEVPDYPGPSASDDAKRSYYRGMQRIYDNQIALEAVEGAAKGDQIAWIDFNMPLDRDGSEFLHLHVVGNEGADTGVFAYNFVRRGFLYGARIVGTLKTGPDLNVLAIFER
jgi:hypothetical protein